MATLDYPYCPYCGGNNPNLIDCDEGIYSCQKCGSDFEVKLEIVKWYTTARV